MRPSIQQWMHLMIMSKRLLVLLTCMLMRDIVKNIINAESCACKCRCQSGKVWQHSVCGGSVVTQRLDKKHSSAGGAILPASSEKTPNPKKKSPHVDNKKKAASSRHTDSVSAFLTLNMRGPSYLGLTRLLTSPGHQQLWYWLCRIGRLLSYLGKDFNYLRRINVEKWHKM